MNTLNKPFSWFIHNQFSQEMDNRLQILRQTPTQILLMGADGNHSFERLAKRYPQAKFYEYDFRQNALEQSLELRLQLQLKSNSTQHQHFFGKLGKLAEVAEKFKFPKLSKFHKLSTNQNSNSNANSQPKQIHQPLDNELQEAFVDMFWANLSLIHSQDIPKTLGVWANALKPDGLLFFSHFGRDSLKEIRNLLTQNNIPFNPTNLMDMHDLGDMVFHQNFFDPVMDTAQMVLTYPQDKTALFWQDMHSVGLWQALNIAPEYDNQAREIVDKSFQNGSLTEITLETVFGHAIKKIVLPENENVVQFYPRKNKSKPE